MLRLGLSLWLLLTGCVTTSLTAATADRPVMLGPVARVGGAPQAPGAAFDQPFRTLSQGTRTSLLLFLPIRLEDKHEPSLPSKLESDQLIRIRSIDVGASSFMAVLPALIICCGVGPRGGLGERGRRHVVGHGGDGCFGALIVASRSRRWGSCSCPGVTAAPVASSASTPSTPPRR